MRWKCGGGSEIKVGRGKNQEDGGNFDCLYMIWARVVIALGTEIASK